MCSAPSTSWSERWRAHDLNLNTTSLNRHSIELNDSGFPGQLTLRWYWGCSQVHHLWRKGRKQPWGRGRRWGIVLTKASADPIERVLKLNGLLRCPEGPSLYPSFSQFVNACCPQKGGVTLGYVALFTWGTFPKRAVASPTLPATTFSHEGRPGWFITLSITLLLLKSHFFV